MRKPSGLPFQNSDMIPMGMFPMKWRWNWSMTKKLTKKQNYVPRFYLRNFTSDNNRLWVFDRVKEEYYFQTPMIMGLQRHPFHDTFQELQLLPVQQNLRMQLKSGREMDGIRPNAGNQIQISDSRRLRSLNLVLLR